MLGLLLVIFLVSYIIYYVIIYITTPTAHLTYQNGYWVHKRFPNKAEAADILAQLQTKVVTKLAGRYPHLKNVILIESPYANNGDSSYTIDKKYVYMCIRKPENPLIFYEIHVLTHVLLHELAHVINTGYGHGSSFKAIFSQLKTEFYSTSEINQADLGVPYCGVFL